MKIRLEREGIPKTIGRSLSLRLSELACLAVWLKRKTKGKEPRKYKIRSVALSLTGRERERERGVFYLFAL